MFAAVWALAPGLLVCCCHAFTWDLQYSYHHQLFADCKDQIVVLRVTDLSQAAASQQD